MPKTLFYAPHSGLWPHAFPEGLVAEALRQGGHEIVYVGCERALNDYCVVMSAWSDVKPTSPPEKKEEVCRDCVAKKNLLKREFKFSGPDLGAELTPDDFREANRILSEVNRENFISLKHLGVEVGRFATYEVLITYKKFNLEFSEAEWNHYLAVLRASVLSLLAGNRILQRERPDYLVAYNALYSANRVVIELAKLMGVSVYFLHSGINLGHQLETLFVGTGVSFDFLVRLKEKWPQFKEAAVGARELSWVTDHFRELLRAQSVFAYSAPKSKGEFSARQFFGVCPGQKLLVATLASYDERFAAEVSGFLPKYHKLLFPSQIEWVRALIQRARSSPHWYLLIRVHPRELPNKREGVKSDHAQRLERELQDLPPNVRINWPADQVSIYDLAEEADVFLNAWSTAGIEMTTLGLPVVVYSPHLAFYPADLNFIGTSMDEYFARIDEALASGWRPERMKYAYRWLSLLYYHSMLRISESYRGLAAPTRAFDKFLLKVRKKLFPLYQCVKDCRQRKPELRMRRLLVSVLEKRLDTPVDLPEWRAGKPPSAEEEGASLRLEIGRLYEALYGEKVGSALGHGIRAGTLRERLRNAATRN